MKRKPGGYDFKVASRTHVPTGNLVLICLISDYLSLLGYKPDTQADSQLQTDGQKATHNATA